ncbi:NmrA family NAD(P)-binding protein [Roseateles chitinivorans]|uniref:NmrA family NAD(P)-binding protein n=1 Tax=Roseateles chitinivorans TaxID=2917965 RepID=UPI003D678EEA
MRAVVHRDDERAQALRDLGAEVVVADMLRLKEMRPALVGMDGAYFCYALSDGLVEATAVFAQAAREAGVAHVVNMSHKQSRPHARSQQTLNHWLSEQVFQWSGLAVTTLRVTFFTEWLLYTAHLIRQGRYVTYFDADSRHAPIAGVDIGGIVAGILHDPRLHAGQTYHLHGPVEYSQIELAEVTGRALGKALPFEQVAVDDFLALLGAAGHPVLGHHFQAIREDQREGLLRGQDNIGLEILGRPLTTVEQFVDMNRAHFV